MGIGRPRTNYGGHIVPSVEERRALYAKIYEVDSEGRLIITNVPSCIWAGAGGVGSSADGRGQPGVS